MSLLLHKRKHAAGVLKDAPRITHVLGLEGWSRAATQFNLHARLHGRELMEGLQINLGVSWCFCPVPANRAAVELLSLHNRKKLSFWVSS